MKQGAYLIWLNWLLQCMKHVMLLLYKKLSVQSRNDRENKEQIYLIKR